MLHWKGRAVVRPFSFADAATMELNLYFRFAFNGMRGIFPLEQVI